MLKVDPAQARQLVSDAGFPNGVELELHFPGSERGQTYVTEVQLIQAQLRKGNINVTLKSVDSVTFGNRERTGDFQLDLQAKPIFGDIDGYVYYNWHSNSVGNFGGVADPKLDALLDQQRREVEPAKREQVLRQITRYIVDNAYYTSFAYGVGYYFWQPYVKNLAPNIDRLVPPVNEAWLQK